MFDGVRSGPEESYSGLGEEFRLVAMDLRGHGLSDKPKKVDKYHPERYADDVSAVLDTLNLVNPILVGWSYGGVVLQDYITKYGDTQIAGINLVDTFVKLSASKNYAPVTHGDTFLEKIASAQEFVRSLTYNELSPRDFYYFLGFSVIAEPLSVVGTVDYTDLLPNINVPALVTRGDKGALAPLRTSETFDDKIPLSQKSYYPRVGHMPFWENSERFNTELAEFARAPDYYIQRPGCGE